MSLCVNSSLYDVLLFTSAPYLQRKRESRFYNKVIRGLENVCFLNFHLLNVGVKDQGVDHATVVSSCLQIFLNGKILDLMYDTRIVRRPCYTTELSLQLAMQLCMARTNVTSLKKQLKEKQIVYTKTIRNNCLSAHR